MSRLQCSDSSLKGIFKNELSKEVSKKDRAQFRVREEILCKYIFPRQPFKEAICQIVIPLPLQEQVLKLCHEDVNGSHFTFKRTFERFCDSFFWPNMKRGLKKYTSSCHICQLAGKPNEFIQKMPWKYDPFENVSISEKAPGRPALTLCIGD